MLWKLQWHGNIIFSHSSSNKKGVLTAFRYGLEYKLLSPEIVDDDGRYIILRIEIQGSPYILFNYYGRNNESNQVKVLRQIFSKLQSINFDDNAQLILAGDWNMIFDKFLDAMGGTPSLKFNSLKQLQSSMVDYDLSDIWRAQNPTFCQFTWRQTNPVKLRHLDFFLISNSLQFDVRLCKFLSPVQSNHSPIVLKISSCASLT